MTTKPKKPVVRVQLDLTEDKIQELQELMDKTGVSTRKDVFENSLTLLHWAVAQSERGRMFGAYDEHTENFHEVLMPALVTARRKYEEGKNKEPNKKVAA